jgi:hypothetical protein
VVEKIGFPGVAVGKEVVIGEVKESVSLVGTDVVEIEETFNASYQRTKKALLDSKRTPRNFQQGGIIMND